MMMMLTLASAISLDNGTDLESEINNVQSRLLDNGASLYRGSNGIQVQVGDTIPEDTSHVTIRNDGNSVLLSLNPKVTGEITEISFSDKYLIADGVESVLIEQDGTAIKTYDVLFAYGQSNCLGKPPLSGDGNVGFPDVTIGGGLLWDVNTSTLIPMYQTIDSWARDSDSASRGHAWGEFSNEWYRQTGRGIILVMGASGGKTIAELSKDSGEELYENAD